MLAPIALFVYKRPKHANATLTALARNTLAKESDLFIFSDGSKGVHDEASVAETRRIIRGITGFRSITLIERTKNQGLANSVIQGVTEVLSNFESVIVLEDDLLTSKEFLTFMNNALKHYRNESKVFSVTGHSFPAANLKIPDDYPYHTFAGYRCSSWSWGIWKDRWSKINWEMDYFTSFISDPIQKNDFNRGGDDLTPMLTMQYQGLIDSWAIRFSFAHYINESICIYPTKTLVRNIGLDNSGTHTRLDKRFLHTSLTDEWLPYQFCRAEPVDEKIVENFRNIFRSEKISLLRRLSLKLERVLKRALLSFKNFLDHLLRPLDELNVKADILMVNTIQRSGGAARAAFRCFTGMRHLYPGARYLSLFSEHTEKYMFALSKKTLKGKFASHLAVLDRLPLLLYPKRKKVIFSPGFWANPRRIRINSFSPSLIHLHWVSFGVLNIDEISDLNVPIVWTLHDEWAFTGGCHYADDCNRFEQQCGQCPLLGSDNPSDASNQLWLKKMMAYSKANILVVTPSRWMAKEARRSSLFSDKRIEVIPNGLDTDIFRPVDDELARNNFDFTASGPILLFGANLVTDHRKGGDLLFEAINKIDYSCVLLVFGDGDMGAIANSNVSVHRLGSIDDDAKLAMMYSMADVFICPSRVDNLPNTVAEAMACGVPCVAFEIGGLPDMIDHLVNGWLASPFDPDDLLKGINWVLKHENPDMLKVASREKALNEFSLSVMSQRYQNLYEELLTEKA